MDVCHLITLCRSFRFLMCLITAKNALSVSGVVECKEDCRHERFRGSHIECLFKIHGRSSRLQTEFCCDRSFTSRHIVPREGWSSFSESKQLSRWNLQTDREMEQSGVAEARTTGLETRWSGTRNEEFPPLQIHERRRVRLKARV